MVALFFGIIADYWLYGKLTLSFWNYFEPYRKKRNYLDNHKDFVVNHLKKGAKKASAVAEVYISNAREAMGLNYEIADI